MWRFAKQGDGNPFVEISSDGALAEWFERDGPNLLFLNDPYCPISGHASREVARLPGPIGLIDVAEGPRLSEEIARRTGVRHESPQIILLHHGRAVWSASHFAVTHDRIREAMAATDLPGTAAPPEKP